MPIRKIGKVFKGAFKGIAKIGGKLFKSKIFKFALAALRFIPGLNGVGLIGKALRVLGSASKIQNFLRTGFQVFRNLVQGKFRLGDAVRLLNVPPFHPLGKLAKLAEGLSGPRRMTDILSAIAPRAGQFEKVIGLTRDLLTSLRKMNLGSLSRMEDPRSMPYSPWPIEQPSAPPGQMEALLSRVNRQVPEFHQRLEHVQQMLQELLSLLHRFQEPPADSHPVIIR